MDKTSIESLLSEALSSERGLVINTSHYAVACGLRRQLYAFRERQRRAGSEQYDGLSFIPKPTGELLVIKRAAMPITSVGSVNSTRELQEGELPKKLIARGKHRPGLLTRLALDAMARD